MFSPVSIGWLVGVFQQDYTKPTEKISMELGWGWISAQSRHDYLLVQIQVEGQIQEWFSLTLPDEMFSDIFIHFSINDL